MSKKTENNNYTKLIENLAKIKETTYDGTTEREDLILSSFDIVFDTSGFVYYEVDMKKQSVCTCGKEHIKYIYYITDKDTNIKYPIGSECIETFIRHRFIDVEEQERIMKLLTKAREWSKYYVSLSAALFCTEKFLDLKRICDEKKSEMQSVINHYNICIINADKKAKEGWRKYYELLETYKFKETYMNPNTSLSMEIDRLRCLLVDKDDEINNLKNEIQNLHEQIDVLESYDTQIPSYDGL